MEVDYKAIYKGSVDLNHLTLSKTGKDFLSKLLVADAQRRFTVDQALKHPWVDLTRDPRHRSDVDIKVGDAVAEDVESSSESDNNCGCDISGQSDFDEEFDTDEESCHCDEPAWDGVVRIGINGLTFCGIRLLKEALKVPEIAVTAVNDAALGGDIDYLLYLLHSDSSRGPPPFINVTYEDKNLVVPIGSGEGKQMKVFSTSSDGISWADTGAEYVFDCTNEAAKHIDNYFKGGAKRVVVVGSDSHNYPNFIPSCNIKDYNKSKKVVGAPSGLVHSMLPLLNTIHSTYGVHEALVTEIKPMGDGMSTVDGPAKLWRFGRAAGLNLIPHHTQDGRVLGDVDPRFKGKVKTMAICVPCHEVSAMDATLVLSNSAPWSHLEETLEAAVASPEMAGVMCMWRESVVSMDFRDSTFDCNLDLTACIGLFGCLV